MEALVNDRLLQDRSATASNQTSPSPSTSTQTLDVVQRRLTRKSLDVSGPVQPYHPHLKNFWYPVAFSNDLKDDTMVNYSLKNLWFILYVSIRINKSTRVALHFVTVSMISSLPYAACFNGVNHLCFSTINYSVNVILWIPYHFSVSDANWLFWGTVGCLSWKRWETWMRPEHLCT